MPGTRVPFFARFGQISLSLITFFSCGLSFWLTVRFCANLAPGHAALELLAIGVTWELAKITFSIKGTHRIKRGTPAQKASGYRFAGLSLLLAAGSIAASLAFLMQTDQHVAQDAAQASQQALRASDAYARDAASLRALDDEMKQLAALAEQYRTKGLVTQGVRTLEAIKPLREARVAQARALAAQEAATANGIPDTATVPGLVASSVWRPVAQVILAVMLEVVGMVTISMLCDDRDDATTGGGALPSRPASHGVRLKVASTRTPCDAGAYRFASGTSPGGGDADGQLPLLHRLVADDAASRITSDARLHRPVSDATFCDADASRLPANLHRIGPDAASIRTTSDAQAHHLWCVSRLTSAGAPLTLAPAADAPRPGRDAQRLCVLYAQAKQLVRDAQVRPCYREMRQALGASQPVVQRFLRALVAEGVLCRSGVRYALVSPCDVRGGVA